MSKYFSLVCNVTYLNFLQSILNALIRAGVAIIIRRNIVVWGVSFQTSGLEEGISIPIFLGRKIYENSYFSFSSPFTLQGRREWHMIGKKMEGAGQRWFFFCFFSRVAYFQDSFIFCVLGPVCSMKERRLAPQSTGQIWRSEKRS